MRDNEGGEGVGIEQRNVSINHEDIAVPRDGKCGNGLLDRTTGARDFVLVDDDALRKIFSHERGEAIAFVPHDRDNVGSVEGSSRGQHVANHRQARKRMQQLREFGAHARALASGQHDDSEAVVGHFVSSDVGRCGFHRLIPRRNE